MNILYKTAVLTIIMLVLAGLWLLLYATTPTWVYWSLTEVAVGSLGVLTIAGVGIAISALFFVVYLLYKWLFFK